MPWARYSSRSPESPSSAAIQLVEQPLHHELTTSQLARRERRGSARRAAPALTVPRAFKASRATVALHGMEQPRRRQRARAGSPPRRASSSRHRRTDIAVLRDEHQRHRASPCSSVACTSQPAEPRRGRRDHRAGRQEPGSPPRGNARGEPKRLHGVALRAQCERRHGSRAPVGSSASITHDDRLLSSVPSPSTSGDSKATCPVRRSPRAPAATRRRGSAGLRSRERTEGSKHHVGYERFRSADRGGRTPGGRPHGAGRPSHRRSSIVATRCRRNGWPPEWMKEEIAPA